MCVTLIMCVGKRHSLNNVSAGIVKVARSENARNLRSDLFNADDEILC